MTATPIDTPLDEREAAPDLQMWRQISRLNRERVNQ